RRRGRAVCFVDERVFVKGFSRDLGRLLPAPLKRKGPLAEALTLATAGKHHVVVGLRPDGLLEAFTQPRLPPGKGEAKRPSLEKMLDELPMEALPFKPLFQARALTATLDAKAELRLSLR